MGFSDFQSKASSEKVGLVIAQATRRITGWSLYSGSVYRVSFPEQVIVSVTEDGTSLSAGSSDSLSASKYWLDRKSGYLYLRTSGSVSPDTVFVVAKVKFFFSNVGISAPHDLSSGFEVPFLPIFRASSNFTVQVSNTKNLLGVALTSGSKLEFENDHSFWGPIFDKYFFESHQVDVYSWERGLDVSEAKLVYRGRLEGKEWSDQVVSFKTVDFLDELRAPVGTADLSTHPTAIISPSFATVQQRRVYGNLKGHVLTPIDQVTPSGYLLTGTVSVSAGGTTLTGSGTSFLNDLSPGDALYIGSYDSKSTIEAIASDTSLTLSEGFGGEAQTAVSFRVVPNHPKRYANRVWLVAGHELSRPSTTVTSVLDASSFFFSDTSFPLREGDFIEVNGQQGEVRILGGGFLKLVNALDTTPMTGDTLYIASVGNVHIRDEKLSITSDFTYSASAATVTLDELAEFNIAPIRAVTGSITITNGSRSVSGSGTIFTEELSSGDWIKGTSKSNWFEVLEVVDDTSLLIRTTPGAADAVSGAAGDRKNPEVITEDTTVSADVLGKPNASGSFLQYAGSIARDILDDAGLSSQVTAASFSDLDQLVPMRMGVAFPAKMRDKKVVSLRDALNTICRSSFSVVTLDEDFNLEMRQIAPEYTELFEIGKGDILDLSVRVDSSDLVGVSKVTYLQKEYDPNGSEDSQVAESVTSAGYLISTAKEFLIDTILVDEDDAEIQASRWAFLQERAASDLRVSISMQGARYKIGDVVLVDYDKLYQRFGSTNSIRIGIVTTISKSVLGTSVVLNDLGNSFSRVCRISETGSDDYDSALDDELAKNGFITDADGFTGENADINLIW